MGFFKKLKKETGIAEEKIVEILATPDDDLEHLTSDGDLPWGWHTRNKEFTDKVNVEYSHFLNRWIDSEKGSPKDLYSALKSFVTYLEDLEALCQKKGECFDFWFREILTSPDYLDKRRSELEEIEKQQRW